MKIPAEAPKLADRALWPSLTVKQGGVFLIGVEVGGIDYPCEHILVVGGFNQSGNALAYG
ncbi:hypothetical protein Barb7_02688 [Bacteroidales bacterium Barb7]|nr:hypothetical protein Barb7_02688 [Bacteroidales bacterium Barb7]